MRREITLTEKPGNYIIQTSVQETSKVETQVIATTITTEESRESMQSSAFFIGAPLLTFYIYLEINILSEMAFGQRNERTQF